MQTWQTGLGGKKQKRQDYLLSCRLYLNAIWLETVLTLGWKFLEYSEHGTLGRLVFLFGCHFMR